MEEKTYGKKVGVIISHDSTNVLDNTIEARGKAALENAEKNGGEVYFYTADYYDTNGKMGQAIGFIVFRLRLEDNGPLTNAHRSLSLFHSFASEGNILCGYSMIHYTGQAVLHAKGKALNISELQAVSADEIPSDLPVIQPTLKANKASKEAESAVDKAMAALMAKKPIGNA